MNIHTILAIFFGIIILILIPFIIKTLNFNNPISVNDFSKLKCKVKPKLGIGFHYFALSPNIPDDFYNKCYKELYYSDDVRSKLDSKLRSELRSELNRKLDLKFYRKLHKN